MKSIRMCLSPFFLLLVLALANCGLEEEPGDGFSVRTDRPLLSECIKWTGSMGSPYWLWKPDSANPCHLAVITFDGGRTNGSMSLSTAKLRQMGARFVTLTATGVGVGYGTLTMQVLGVQGGVLSTSTVSLGVPSNAPDKAWRMVTAKIPLTEDNLVLSVSTKADIQKNMQNDISSVIATATAQ